MSSPPPPEGETRKTPGASSSVGAGTGSSSRRGRSHWIDAVRVALTVLVIAHHCAVTYGNIPVWYYNEIPGDPSAVWLDAFVIMNQTWFMGLFFFLSGYFAPASVDRRGPGRFVRDRLIRLGLPFLGFVLVVRPIASSHEWWTVRHQMSYQEFYLRTVDAGPAWFLEVLLVFSLVYAGVRALFPRWSWPGRSDGPLSRTTIACALFAFTAVMAFAGALWRQVVPDGTHWSVVGLPTPSFLPQYVLMFAAGCVAARYRWLERLPASVAFPGVGISVCVLVLFGPTLVTGSPVEVGAATGVVVAVLGVGISLAVLMAFRQLAQGTGPVRAFLARNAFAVYVIHPAVLVVLALSLQQFSAPPVLKFAVLLGLSTPSCWLLAALLRRIPGVDRVL